MDPYYSTMNTFGPINEGAGVDRGMHQFFGAANGPDLTAFANTVHRTTLWEIVSQNRHINLYGKGVGEAGTNAAAATAGGATIAFLSGAVIVGLAVNYGLGRFVAAPAIEYFSGNKLTDKQKNAVGITAMIF